MKNLILSLAALLALTVSTQAVAQERTIGTGFGSQGRLVISEDAQFDLGFDTNGDGPGYLLLRIRPSMDYFVAPNLSIGAFLDLGLVSGDGFSETTVGLGGRVGYNIPLGTRLSIWPRLGLGLVHESNDSGAFDSSGTFFNVIIDAPLLYHPADHFFVGVGPTLNIRAGDADGVFFGLTSLVGGHF